MQNYCKNTNRTVNELITLLLNKHLLEGQDEARELQGSLKCQKVNLDH